MFTEESILLEFVETLKVSQEQNIHSLLRQRLLPLAYVLEY